MDQFTHDPFAGQAADDTARNRHEARDSLFLMADFRIAGSDKVQSVRVRNLSAGGLMAEYPAGLEQGLTVEVDVRGVGWVSGHVAWSAAGRIGVAFVSPIDPMLARKPVSGGAKAAGFRPAPVLVKPRLPKR